MWKIGLALAIFYGSTALAQDFLPEPDIEKTPNQNYYRTLYLDSLEAKIAALEKAGEDTRAVKSKIWGLFPELDNPPPLIYIEDKLARLHVLYVQKNVRDIPTFLTLAEIAAYQGPKKCLALVEWGGALKELKDPLSALEAFETAAALPCPEDIATRALFWKGKLEWETKNDTAALSTYGNFIKKYPHHRYTDDAAYALWKIHAQEGQTATTIRARETLLRLPEGDMRDKVLWEEAYGFYKKKEYKKAISELDKMGNNPQALYWKARILKSRVLYQKVEREFPFSFYSVLASNRLGRAASRPIPEISEPLFPETPLGLKLRAAYQLPSSTEMQNELDYITQTEEIPLELERLIALLWVRAGDYNQALRMADKNETPKPDDALVLALYPQAFQAEVKAGYQQTSLPEGVLEGIMREESRFLPKICSSAGAVGLMQLMPATAAIQARKLGLAEFSTKKLEDPETNILLGSSFFQKMVTDFGGEIPLAIMAYNAGPGNVHKWLKAQGNLPLDEFIEEIPFSETRGYVKRVLSSIQVYGYLLKSPDLQKPFFSMKL